MLAQGICRLCGANAPLLKRSHVIPDFMYSDVYDEKHRLILFAPAAAVKGDTRVQRPSSAPYDSGILCAQCDNKTLGGYEDYAAKLLFGKNLPPSLAPTVQNFVNPADGYGESKVTNMDYNKFKLFALGMLWKSHISKQPFFSDISLGPHADSLRGHLLSGIAPGQDAYPVFMLGWLRETSFSKEFVVKPLHFRWQGKHHGYLYMFRGLIIFIFISDQADTTALDRHKVLSNGTVSIFNMHEGAVRYMFSRVCGLDPKVLNGYL